MWPHGLLPAKRRPGLEKEYAGSPQDGEQESHTEGKGVEMGQEAEVRVPQGDIRTCRSEALSIAVERVCPR